jgi:hypothetical protein
LIWWILRACADRLLADRRPINTVITSAGVMRRG